VRITRAQLIDAVTALGLDPDRTLHVTLERERVTAIVEAGEQPYVVHTSDGEARIAVDLIEAKVTGP
jgi:hypothetical protein